MMVKLIQEMANPEAPEEMLPEGSILEVDEDTGKQLIADGIAVPYDEEAETQEVEEEVKKSINILVKAKKVNKKEEKKEVNTEYIHAKAFKSMAKMAKEKGGQLHIDSKAVAGMSEGGANTGAEMVYTELSEMLGQWAGASSVANLCRQRQLGAGANATELLIDTFEEYQAATTPAITGVAEGTTKTVGAAPTLSITVQPKVEQCIIAVTDEMLEDIPYLDSYLRQKLNQKLANKIDQNILAGSYGAACGFYGIENSGATYCTDVTLDGTTPTLAQLFDFEEAIEPSLRPGATWVISNTQWGLIKGTLVGSANVDRQIVQLGPNGGGSLIGYPVVVTGNANTVCLGNFNEYTVVGSRLGTKVDVSMHVYFTTDQVVFRITNKCGGAPTYAVRDAADSSKVGAFAIKA